MCFRNFVGREPTNRFPVAQCVRLRQQSAKAHATGEGRGREDGRPRRVGPPVRMRWRYVI